jgi:hypothetical protein
MGHAGALKPSGSVSLSIIRKDAWVPEEVRRFSPRSELGRYIKNIVLQFLPREAMIELVERVSRTMFLESALALARYRDARWDGTRWLTDQGARLLDDLGTVSRRVITNNGGGFIVDAFQNLVEMESMKYHGLGTGATAENVADTALVTELTTAYNPDNTRATGSTTETSQLVYQTVGTNTVDGTAAVTEHGIFAAATGAVALFDRSVFSVVNLASGDSLQSTYNLTITAGG